LEDLLGGLQFAARAGLQTDESLLVIQEILCQRLLVALLGREFFTPLL